MDLPAGLTPSYGIRRMPRPGVSVRSRRATDHPLRYPTSVGCAGTRTARRFQPHRPLRIRPPTGMLLHALLSQTTLVKQALQDKAQPVASLHPKPPLTRLSTHPRDHAL
jgi:hypothetical protein